MNDTQTNVKIDLNCDTNSNGVVINIGETSETLTGGAVTENIMDTNVGTTDAVQEINGCEGIVTENIEYNAGEKSEEKTVNVEEITNTVGEKTIIEEATNTVEEKAIIDEIGNKAKIEKSSVTELQKIVQKLEKLEKMINPNSKKSLILWEEDNSFKNIISSIVNYAKTCDTAEFPIELLDRLKALSNDVDNQISEGAVKVEELTKQAKTNTELSEILSTVYIAAMAGSPIEEYEEKIQHEEICAYKEHLAIISTSVPESEEYLKAEKAIKSKITNLENSVHITIDLERTTSKGGALQYIKTEITPAVERLQAEYDKQYNINEATEITGEEAVMALAVRKTFSEKVYDTFVRPFANLFKRKSKVK